MNALISKGIKVPEDMAVIGFDDSSVCRLVTPALTSIRMQTDKIAKKAIDILYQMHTVSTTPETVKFTSELVLRDSTNADL